MILDKEETNLFDEILAERKDLTPFGRTRLGIPPLNYIPNYESLLKFMQLGVVPIDTSLEEFRLLHDIGRYLNASVRRKEALEVIAEQEGKRYAIFRSKRGNSISYIDYTEIDAAWEEAKLAFVHYQRPRRRDYIWKENTYSEDAKNYFNALTDMLSWREEILNDTTNKTRDIFFVTSSFASYREELASSDEPKLVTRVQLTSPEKFIRAEDKFLLGIALYHLRAHGCTDYQEIYSNSKLIEVTAVPVQVTTRYSKSPKPKLVK